MRCIVCGRLSLDIVCKTCAHEFLTPKYSQITLHDLEIVYCYKYDDIAPLLLTKHTPVGHRVLTFVGKKTFARFQIPYTLMPIDHRVKSGYSHSAVIAKQAGKHRLFNKLQAANEVVYSGQSKAYRQNNPRGFVYSGPAKKVVLVDDIFTTGSTLLEAKQAVEKGGAQVLFALTLAH